MFIRFTSNHPLPTESPTTQLFDKFQLSRQSFPTVKGNGSTFNEFNLFRPDQIHSSDRFLLFQPTQPLPTIHPLPIHGFVRQDNFINGIKLFRRRYRHLNPLPTGSSQPLPAQTLPTESSDEIDSTSSSTTSDSSISPYSLTNASTTPELLYFGIILSKFAYDDQPETTITLSKTILNLSQTPALVLALALETRLMTQYFVTRSHHRLDSIQGGGPKSVKFNSIRTKLPIQIPLHLVVSTRLTCPFLIYWREVVRG
ncbi:hypothetical protein JCM5350_007820 [Sporobolomyces pararoseus]